MQVRRTLGGIWLYIARGINYLRIKQSLGLFPDRGNPVIAGSAENARNMQGFSKGVGSFLSWCQRVLQVKQ